MEDNEDFGDAFEFVHSFKKMMNKGDGLQIFCINLF
jgi:hypothetical protein